MTTIKTQFPKKLKLTTEDPTEQRVLDYLNKNASEVLAEKINAGKKTLAGALNYAKGEARKLADGGNCICVDDDTVFGWVIHFFEEDSIKEGAKKSGAKVPSGVKKKPAKKSKPKKQAKPDSKNPLVLELFSAEEMGSES